MPGAESKRSQIGACQCRKTQRDSERAGAARTDQKAGREQQGKEQATLNHSRSTVDDEYTFIHLPLLLPGA